MNLWNFGIWCLQVAIIVAAGSTLPSLFRLTSPKVRLVFWQVVLVICLGLPWIQPYRLVSDTARGSVSIATGPLVLHEDAASANSFWNFETAAMAVLGAGAILRFVLLGAGFVRLHRLRRSATLAQSVMQDLPDPIHALAPHAVFYQSEAITSPVTFGSWNPVVILPRDFLELTPERRAPIVCHELLHIRRSDWLFAVGEEIIRALLWFHPAIWWLLGQIQLTREQSVDHAVIAHTQAQDAYVDALLAIATSRIEADLAPAPLFLRKRHLHQRIASISRGVSMPKRKLVLSALAVFSALPLIVGVTAWQLPLNATPQDAVDSPGIEIHSAPYAVLHRTGVAYPAEALGKRISGTVVLAVSINSKGDVVDASVVSGPEALRKSAMQSVLDWHFAIPEARTTPAVVEVTVRYDAEKHPAISRMTPADQTTQPLESLELSSLPAALRDRVAAANLVQPGEMINGDRYQQLSQSLMGIDDHLRLSSASRNGRLVLRAYLANQAPARIRIGGNVQSAKLVSKVVPVYPRAAKEARIQGTVRMQVVIDKEGKVTQIETLSGPAELVDSAVEAVRQWVYQTTLLNGQPVEVMTMVDVNYTLAP